MKNNGEIWPEKRQVHFLWVYEICFQANALFTLQRKFQILRFRENKQLIYVLINIFWLKENPKNIRNLVQFSGLYCNTFPLHKIFVYNTQISWFLKDIGWSVNKTLCWWTRWSIWLTSALKYKNLLFIRLNPTYKSKVSVAACTKHYKLMWNCMYNIWNMYTFQPLLNVYEHTTSYVEPCVCAINQNLKSLQIDIP